MPNEILAKNKTQFDPTKVRTHNQSIRKQLYNQFNQLMFRDHSHNSIIILPLHMIKHNYKNNYNLNST